MVSFLDNFLDNPKVYPKKSANLLDKYLLVSFFINIKNNK